MCEATPHSGRSCAMGCGSKRVQGPSASLQMISVPMKAALFRLNPDEFAALRCLHCCKPLELHQPTEDMPEQLIGVCPHCWGSWHVIDIMQGRLYALVVLLPPSKTLWDLCSVPPKSDQVYNESEGSKGDAPA